MHGQEGRPEGIAGCTVSSEARRRDDLRHGEEFQEVFWSGSAAGTSQSLIANAESRNRRFIPGQRATAEGLALLG
ncbi:MAG: hypothetical protein ABL921_31605 [Pirellula sp.]